MTKKISIDYETFLIAPECVYPKPICVSAYIDGEEFLYTGEEMRVKVKEWLEEEDAIIIAQNAEFEVLVTYFHFPELRPQLIKALDEGRIYCTKIYEQLKANIEPTASQGKISIKDLKTNKSVPLYRDDGIPNFACHQRSLAGLVKHYFNEDISASKKDDDAWRLRYHELYLVPIEKTEGLGLLEINKLRAAEGLPPTQYDHWPTAAVRYAIDDSIWAFKVYVKQQRAKPGIQHAQHLRAAVALNHMTFRGIRVDLERVKTLDKEISEILTPIYEELEAAGFAKRDKNGKFGKNTKVLRDYIAENFEMKLTTIKGDIAVDSESLKAYLSEKEDPILQKFQVLGKYEKAKSSFTARLLKADPNDPVVRTQYNPIVTSGRTSASTSSLIPCSIGIQQVTGGLTGVTYDIRGCMRAREGYKFVSVDYNNLELLAVAHQTYELYGFSKMRDMINYGEEPTDLHSVFACELKGSAEATKVTYDEFVKQKKEPGFKEYRKKGKPVTLGCPGGMGYKTIRHQFNKEGIILPYKVVKAFDAEWKAHAVVRDFRSQYPDLRVERSGPREWQVVRDEVVMLRGLLYRTYPELEKFLKDGHKQFLNGKYRWKKNEFGDWEKDELYSYHTFGQSLDNCTYTALCNGWLMQSTASVGAKESGWNLFKEFHDSDEVHILAFIHDEYCAEVKDNENLQKNVDRISEIMIDAQMKYLTSVDVAVEAEVMTYWSKEVNEWSRQYYKKQSDKILRKFD